MPVHDPNPLKELLLDEGATLFAYGVAPAEPGVVRRAEAGESAETPPLLAAAFGAIELEYASLRTNCVIMDRPDRAVIEVSGADALEFLGRMLTQDVAALKPGESCNSFWLNRKGRIDADVRVLRLEHEQHGKAFLDLERGSLESTIKTLGAYIITEDVTLTPRPDLHRLSLHGPTARDLLLAASESYANILNLRPNVNVWDEMPDGVDCWIDQHDTTGVPGYELFVRADDAREVYEFLMRCGRPGFMREHDAPQNPAERGAALVAVKAVALTPETNGPGRALPGAIRLRPCGWFAYNIARIEAGTPLFKVDFGPENLPAETGVIEDRVNFKKGCYLGQEIVARMHARGHPKQRLVALRFEDDLPAGADGLPPMPVQGDPVLSTDDPGKPLGSVTSSTFSPMLGRVPIALAMVAWSHVEAGTTVTVETEGLRLRGTVQQSLRFLP